MLDQNTVDKIFAILDRYFAALENGTTAFLMPDPKYRWRRKVTLEQMRSLLKELDDYWWEQRSYSTIAELQPEAGPELNRLPDNAVWALAQELDEIISLGSEQSYETDS